MTIKLRQKELKDGNISLYLDYYDKGKREYEFLDLYIIPDDAKYAKEQNANVMKKASAILAERRLNPEGRFAKAERNEDLKGKYECKITLTQWIQQYHDMRKCGGASDKTLWNFSHIKELVEAYLKHSRKHDPKMNRLTKDFINGFLLYLQNDHQNFTYKNSVRKLTPGSLKQYQQQLSTILKGAEVEGIIDINPMRMMTEKELFPNPEPDREFLTIDELKRFMEVKVKAEQNKQAFVFACFTGLRISDIRSVRWCDILGINGIPHIRTTMIKTKKPIFVPLSMNAMLWLPKRQVDAKDTDVIFDKLPQQSSLNDFVQRTARFAGIKKHLSFHSSRHTFATLTLRASGDLYTTSKLLGHSKIKTTQVYATVMNDAMKDAVKLTEGVLG